MADPPVRLDPPGNEVPLAEDGRQHTEAWAQYHQAMSDRLLGLPALLRHGVTDGSDAAAGEIGEYLTATGTVALASATFADITTLALPAGDWMVEGNIGFTPDALTVPKQIIASVGTASATPGTARTSITGTAAIITPPGFPNGLVATFLFGLLQQIGTGGAVRFNNAAPVTAYLVGAASWVVASTLAAGGTLSATGTIWARRMR